MQTAQTIAGAFNCKLTEKLQKKFFNTDYCVKYGMKYEL